MTSSPEHKHEEEESSDDDDDDSLGGSLPPIFHEDLSLPQRLLISQDLINAVSFLHSKHLAHGDINSSNVLIHDLSVGLAPPSANDISSHLPLPRLLCVRLSDFGSAQVQASFTGKLGSTLRGHSAAGGTLRWSAPELLLMDGDGQSDETYAAAVAARTNDSSVEVSSSSSDGLSPKSSQTVSSQKYRSADVYSLSLLLAELFTSLPPYADLPNGKVHHAIFTCRPPYNETLLNNVSPALTRLVRACSGPVVQRATLAQLKYQFWPDLLAGSLRMEQSVSHLSCTD